MSTPPEGSPLVQQYLALKERFKEEFLFFQVGDFYELFFEDAKKVAALLSIVLTKKGTHLGEDIPLCGVPLHTAEHYYNKLARMGYTVVLCNQVSPAIPGKLVQREPAQVITAATIMYDGEETGEQRLLSAFISEEESGVGLIFFEFITQKYSWIFFEDNSFLEENVLTLLSSLVPKEIYLTKERGKRVKTFLSRHGFTIKERGEITNNEQLLQWKEYSILPSYCCHTASLFFHFLSLYYPHLINALFFDPSLATARHLLIDFYSKKNLELYSQESQEKNHTLFSLINFTRTPMGKRRLKDSLLRPFHEKAPIEHRLNLVAFFIKNNSLRTLVQKKMEKLHDLERIAGRITLKKAGYSDYQKLTLSLPLVKEIALLLEEYGQPIDLRPLIALTSLSQYLADRIILSDTGQGQKINPHNNETLLSLQNYCTAQSAILYHAEKEENMRWGKEVVTIKKTPLYGYVFEIAKQFSDQIPPQSTRVQTLTQKERYITPALKRVEEKIVQAEASYQEQDEQLYQALQAQVIQAAPLLSAAAEIIGTIDLWLSLAECASRYHWQRPSIDETSKVFSVLQGNHPIIAVMNRGDFVENSLLLEEKREKTWIITGPNMGGKSTFMRQNALIAILAHMGSFVPAQRATVPLLDRIFTRIGSYDNTAKGKSTFYIEMEEIATICSLATKKSFVIVDEVGKGTSTKEGVAIAGAIINYIVHTIGSFTLFSTHYHELAALMKQQNSPIAWKKVGIIRHNNELSFSYTLEEGVAEESYSVLVAKKVNLPSSIIEEAIRIQKKYNEKTL